MEVSYHSIPLAEGDGLLSFVDFVDGVESGIEADEDGVAVIEDGTDDGIVIREDVLHHIVLAELSTHHSTMSVVNIKITTQNVWMWNESFQALLKQENGTCRSLASDHTDSTDETLDWLSVYLGKQIWLERCSIAGSSLRPLPQLPALDVPSVQMVSGLLLLGGNMRKSKSGEEGRVGVGRGLEEEGGGKELLKERSSRTEYLKVRHRRKTGRDCLHKSFSLPSLAMQDGFLS